MKAIFVAFVVTAVVVLFCNSGPADARRREPTASTSIVEPIVRAPRVIERRDRRARRLGVRRVATAVTSKPLVGPEPVILHLQGTAITPVEKQQSDQAMQSALDQLRAAESALEPGDGQTVAADLLTARNIMETAQPIYGGSRGLSEKHIVIADDFLGQTPPDVPDALNHHRVAIRVARSALDHGQ